MIQNCLRVFNDPISLAHWCVKWCCQINNVSARKSLNWQVPLTISQGWTPDISHLRFYFFEPIWYFQPNIKSPKNNLLKGRFLSSADSCGEALTYYILTKPKDKKTKRQVLTRSAVRTQRKYIGTLDEYGNNNAEGTSFVLSLSEQLMNNAEVASADEVPLLLPGEKIAKKVKTLSSVQPTGEQQSDPDPELEVETVDKEDSALDPHEEKIPSDTDATNDAVSHNDIVESTNFNITTEMEFRKILDHFWKNGFLYYKAQYTDSVQGMTVINTPLPRLKQDEPVYVAKYIKKYIVEPRRGNRPFNDWDDKTIERYNTIARRLIHIGKTLNRNHVSSTARRI